MPETDTEAPFEIRVRRDRGTLAIRELDDLEAAGIVAADECVTVTAVFAAEECNYQPGEPVPAIYAEVYVQFGEAVTRWSSSELTYADKRYTLAMRQVIGRAQRIADLANALAHGEDPGPLLVGPSDRVADEVAADMQRSWGLAHCTEANAPVLGDSLARQLAFHAMARLCIIRDREGTDSLPGSRPDLPPVTRFAEVDVTSKIALMAERRRTIDRLQALEDALHDHHGFQNFTV
jgi:hypothetical protein